jgi:putative membrane protein
MMQFDTYHFWGMHFMWWFIWGVLLFWIFATPYAIPGQRTKRDSPLNVLKKRLALGQMSKEEYLELKKLLEA